MATVPELNDEIDAQLPTNAVGQITASKLRTVLHDMTNSLSSLGGSTIAGGGLGFTFDTRAAAVSTIIPTVGASPPGPNWIRTTGYATTGDGGGGLYVRVGGTPSYSNLVWFSSADGQKWGLVVNNDPLKLEQAGGGPNATGAANNAAADAIHSIFYTNKSGFPAGYTYAGPNIQLGLGTYNFAGPWFIKGSSTIHGLSHAMYGGRGTLLKFPAGSDGIVLGGVGNNGRLYNPGLYGNEYYCPGTVIRDLAIQGGWLLNGAIPYSQNNSTGERGIGILTKTMCHIENVYISGFAEFGVYSKGSGGGGGSATEPTPGTADNTDSSESYVCSEGNPNLFLYQNVTCETIGCDGFRDRGADSNAGTYIKCSADLCYAWGFNSLCFLGNNFWSCHAATNGFRWQEQSRLDTNTGALPGSYQAADASNSSNFVACYSEGGLPGGKFLGFSVVFGGLHAAGSPVQTGNNTTFAWKTLSAHSTGSLGGTIHWGDANVDGEIWNFNTDIFWRNQGGRYDQGNFFKPEAFSQTLGSYAGAQGRGSTIGAANILFGYGFWLGGPQINRDNDQRFTGMSDGLPTAGKWARGDFIRMVNPSAGGVWAYVCTTSGDYAGTAPVWKSVGNLAA